MKSVYLLRSLSVPERTYVGSTNNLGERLEKHNSGGSPHTSKHRPWEIVVSLAFEDNKKAEAFEKYLKSGSGRAFAKRHFL